VERAAISGGIQRAPRSRSLVDPLYGALRVSSWASAMLATAPFQRLAGVSLSDVPGELLFGRAFPSRLDHTLGVYHLARLARPQDRSLHVAALAHDLGHGPFSHLSEPLMCERLREDHEQRSARLLGVVRVALEAMGVTQPSWLNWDDVARLIVGREDGRGALLNGRLDYDNTDNVARFLRAGGLGMPSYDPLGIAASAAGASASQTQRW
jgi:HD superfamily phosphohydrolase